MEWPRVIQGGMGVGVSAWTLAREVAAHGQLGVVSGTALDTLMIRRLQDGDAGGHVRRALAAFPLRDVAARALAQYFRAEPSADSPRYALASLLRARLTPAREALLVLANFVEVHLAREGHSGLVGINYLEKIQLATLPSLYGAMLAGVAVVLMGAGIPSEIPAAIDRLSAHAPASITLDVLDASTEPTRLTFDPRAHWPQGAEPAPLARPRFLPIVSSATLARALLKKCPGGIDGFVVEGPIAGGHNAPPRGELKLSPRGEPVYGPRDDVDLEQMRALGVPFWLAGAQATRQKLAGAIAAGARGIQAGTVFALCEESGLAPDLRRRLLARALERDVDVFTDPVASPTGYPFKVVSLDGTLSDPAAYADRPRRCDLGYLRRAYRTPEGTLDYRCPAEPVDDYVAKGGRAEDTVGRKCLCNALLANIGMAQRRGPGNEELPMLTTGDDLTCVRQFITPERLSYHARDVIDALLAPA